MSRAATSNADSTRSAVLDPVTMPLMPWPPWMVSWPRAWEIRLFSLVDVEDVRPRQGRGGQLEPGNVPGVAVGFADAGHAGIRVDLHDGPQGERFMDANGVQQRRVLEGDRRDGHAGNPGLVEVRAGSYAWSTALCSLGWLGGLRRVDFRALFTDHKVSHRSKSKLIYALNNSVRV